MTEMVWTRETALAAGRRVVEALGRWPSRDEWRVLARQAAQAGDPLPSAWFIYRAFGRAVGALPPEEERRATPCLELAMSDSRPEIVTGHRVPAPTPLGSCTYIFSNGGRATAIIIDLIPPEPVWAFDHVTVIPWGCNSRTRELTQRFGRDEYLQHREEVVGRLLALALRSFDGAQDRQAQDTAAQLPPPVAKPPETTHEVRERLRRQGKLKAVRQAVQERKRREREEGLCTFAMAV